MVESMCPMGISGLGHVHYAHGWLRPGFGGDCPCFVVVGESRTELAVEFQLVPGLGLAQRAGESAELVHDLAYPIGVGLFLFRRSPSTLGGSRRARVVRGCRAGR
ncbi:hypothetical protein GCM10009660_02250 [Catellatospora bangladeshensis]